jgi:pyridoxal 5'-phosphate synthase pdxT subunit
VVVQANILVTAFHPELTADDRWHRYFMESLVVPTLL